jgi:hypothetical protein
MVNGFDASGTSFCQSAWRGTPAAARSRWAVEPFTTRAGAVVDREPEPEGDQLYANTTTSYLYWFTVSASADGPGSKSHSAMRSRHTSILIFVGQFYSVIPASTSSHGRCAWRSRNCLAPSELAEPVGGGDSAILEEVTTGDESALRAHQERGKRRDLVRCAGAPGR